MRKICFRADASAQIGYGHFIRTLALADMLKDDFDCVFYTAEPSSYQIGEMQKVCSYVPLSEKTKFEDFVAMLDGSEIVVLDNYFFTTDYQRAIKAKGCKLVCIDDMHNKHYVADAVVNYGLVDLHDFSVEKYTRLCLGRDYLLLRSSFLKYLVKKERKKQILINFGGADPYRITENVTSILLAMNLDKQIIVILGNNVYLSEENRTRVTVFSNLNAEQMAMLMRESELGIFSASTISYEGRSQHLAMLVGYYVDNQKEYFEKSIKQNGFIPLYDLKNINKNILEKALKSVSNIQLDDYDYTQIPNRYVSLFKYLSNDTTPIY